jgi:hypothetical protein
MGRRFTNSVHKHASTRQPQIRRTTLQPALAPTKPNKMQTSPLPPAPLHAIMLPAIQTRGGTMDTHHHAPQSPAATAAAVPSVTPVPSAPSHPTSSPHFHFPKIPPMSRRNAAIISAERSGSPLKNPYLPTPQNRKNPIPAPKTHISPSKTFSPRKKSRNSLFLTPPIRPAPSKPPA